jgi:signal transduction histidine kinase/GAF domain-containing protein
METRTQAPTPEQSAIVERVARIVSRVRGSKPDYAHLAAELEPAIPFDVFGIVLLRYDKEAVRVAVCTRVEDTWVSHYHQHPFKDSMVERILHRNETVFNEEGEGATETESHSVSVAPIVQDLAAIEIKKYPEGLDGPPAQSGDALSGKPYLHATLIAPLVVEHQVLGSLELGSTRIDAYTDETLQRLIGAVAHVLAAAIESAQVGGSVEIQDRQREELKNVSSALASEADLSKILHRIVIGIAKALNVASAIITLDKRRGSLKLIAQYGLDRDVLNEIVRREIALTEQTIIGYSLRHRQDCVSNDIALDSRFPESQLFASQLGIHSILSYPLVTGSTIFGALLLCSREPGGFTPLKFDILSLFASQATIAIHNDMLLEAARERRRFQQAIERLDATRQKNSSTGPDDLLLLKTIQEETERTFGISFSSLLNFISDYMLTSSERDLQGILHTIQDEQKDNGVDNFSGAILPLLQVERTTTLVEMAESALTRAGLLEDTSATLSSDSQAITQLSKRIARDITVPWFVTDPQGRCVYVNHAAEVISGMRFVPQTSSLTLMDAFVGLLPRIRNTDEVLMYLREFSNSELNMDNIGSVERKQHITQIDFPPANTLRCVIAAEPLLKRSSQQFQGGAKVAEDREPISLSTRTAKMPRNRFSDPQNMYPDSAPSDRHYQFMRFTLYNPQGQLLANALQIQDISEQVRDEKNKSVLLSTVSHDLRTPLTTIKAAVTGLLQPGVSWDERMLQEILADIDMEADHLDALINSFIDMSRIDMGALVLEKEWCDLVEIVHSAVARDECLLANHPVRTNFQAQLSMVQVDYVQLKKVLHNLLENAVRHSSENTEIVIAIDTVVGRNEEAGSSEDTSLLLRVRVIDHGSGIPKGEQERIFKAFYSLDSQGNGLGLAICRGIIEAHQGRIWVEPVPGGGSCFAFVLPISS